MSLKASLLLKTFIYQQIRTTTIRPTTTPPFRRLYQLRNHLTIAQNLNHTAAISRIMAAEIPKTMKGVVINKTGGVEVLEYKTDLPVPEPKEGEVLIKNEFSGVNYIDTYFRTGLYPAPLPRILGQESEGTIVSLHPSAATTHPSLTPGTRVVALLSASAGYAEYSATKASSVFPIPSSIAPGIAAAALLQGLTALTLIREAYHVQAGDYILVHAAAGGVGLWLCQLLRIVGARTIATASTAEKLALAKENGAEFLINYSVEDWVARVKEITNGAGAIAIFDGVGKATFDGDLEAAARKGTVVSFGNASGAVEPFAIARLGAKNLKIARTRLGAYLETEEEWNTYCKELFGWVERGEIKVRVHEVYPLEEVRRAHEDIEGRKTTGKLLLKL